MALSSWLEELDDPSSASFPEAAHAVHEIGERAVPVLLGMLWKKPSGFDLALNDILEKQSRITWRPLTSNEQRNRAWTGFAVLGPLGASAIPQLTKQMDDSDEDIVHAAVAVLGRLGAKATPALRLALTHTNPIVRAQAIRSFSEPMVATTEVLSEGLRLFHDPDPSVRIAALQSLSWRSNSWQSIWPSWRPLLKDSDQRVRINAVSSLRLASVNAREAVPDLMEMLCATVNGDEVRTLVPQLKRLGATPSDVVPCLIGKLDTHNLQLQIDVAKSLAGYGAAARSTGASAVARRFLTNDAAKRFSLSRGRGLG